uniref:LRAT domain-containing protein n=1 Tax=Cyprinus carpio carpio TaxID=630221 RepID=A0A8C1EUR9_CYPCA
MNQNRNLKPGDLIEMSRKGYQHWVIYVGDGYVVHVVIACGHGSSGAISVTTGKDCKVTVKKEKLQDVVGNDKYSINNYLDDTYVPRPIEDILQEAERFVGKEFPYNLLLNNCEHFATLVRYGKPHSQQAERAKNKIIIAIINAGNVYGIMALATLIPIKEEEEEEKKEKVEQEGDDEL